MGGHPVCPRAQISQQRLLLAIVADISYGSLMGKTKRHSQMLYLDYDKAALLSELAMETRIVRAVLLREAVDDLLLKYKKLKPPKRKP